MSGMRYTICFGLRMRKNELLHTTTENKIGWENLEYDIRMVFSETSWPDLYDEEMPKSKVSKEKMNISLS